MIEAQNRESGVYKEDFDSSKSSGQDLSTDEVSVVQVDIQIQGRNSTFVQRTSFIIGKTIEMRPSNSLLSTGR